MHTPRALLALILLVLPSSLAAQESPEAEAPQPQSYCRALGVSEDAEQGAVAFALGQTQARVGQHALAVESFCRSMALAPKSKLDALQQLRRSFVAQGRSDGLPLLLADLTRALAARAEELTGEPQRTTWAHAGARLDELEAVAPADPNLPELRALLGRVQSQRPESKTHWSARLRSLLGMAVLLGIAFALSTNRKAVSLRLVLWGLGLQAFFALVILLTPPGKYVFDGARSAINKILSFTDDGAGFIFGNIYYGIGPTGSQGPLSVVDGNTGDIVNVGLIFVLHVLPTIIFFGALMSILFHLGVIQRVVKVIALAMQRTMGTSGSESLSAAGNIFVGQTEAPLVIKPYLPKMTRSELMAIMCGGFATVAGGVLAAYTRFGLDPGHLLAASVMSAPAALVVAKIMYPETEESDTAGGVMHDPERQTTNVIDAAASGASDGLKLAANVGAMLIAFIGLIALLNYFIGLVGGLFGAPALALKDVFGAIFYPLSWCMGVDTADLVDFGNLLGIKVSINEFVAFVELGALKDKMTERSFTIATYALTGFANFSSIGIQIGGIAAIAPERRQDLAALGLKAMIGGAIASWLTACIAGVLL